MNKYLTTALGILILSCILSCNSCKNQNKPFSDPNAFVPQDTIHVGSYKLWQRPDNTGLPVYLTIFDTAGEQIRAYELTGSEAVVALSILKLGPVVYDKNLKFIYSTQAKVETALSVKH